MVGVINERELIHKIIAARKAQRIEYNRKNEDKILLRKIYYDTDRLTKCEIEDNEEGTEYECFPEEYYRDIKRYLDELEKIKGRDGRIKGTKVAIKARKNSIRKYQKRIDAILKKMQK